MKVKDIRMSPAYCKDVDHGVDNALLDVLIVGAGLAGLSCALLLKKAGTNFQLLEAKPNAGGRVHTVRKPFDDGLYAEKGAARFPLSHHLTLKYLKAYNMNIVPFNPATGNYSALLEGHLHSFKSGEFPPILDSSKGAKMLHDGITEIIHKYITPQLDSVRGMTSASSLSKEQKRLDAISWNSFLLKSGMSQKEIDVFNAAISIKDNGKEISALFFLRDMLTKDTKFKVKGGNDQLPLAMASQVASKTQYNAQVLDIDKTADCYTVIYLQEGCIKQIKAKVVVLAIPFTVLRRLNIHSLFSREQWAMINNLRYCSATRMTLQFKGKPLKKRRKNGYGISDKNIEYWQPTHDQNTSNTLIQTYFMSNLSERFGSMSEAQRIRTSRHQIERLFPETIGHFEKGISKCWDEDPFARGGISIYQPGQLDKLKTFFKPSGSGLFIAGEHISPWSCWMQGALHSGEQAARSVINHVYSRNTNHLKPTG